VKKVVVAMPDKNKKSYCDSCGEELSQYNTVEDQGFYRDDMLCDDCYIYEQEESHPSKWY
jgi:formylmethanofuran dehydrogenase subunit E